MLWDGSFQRGVGLIWWRTMTADMVKNIWETDSIHLEGMTTGL